MTDYNKTVYEYLSANQNLPAVYTFNYKDFRFVGLNTVFSPTVFEDTFFFCDNLPFNAGDKALEIGCGTGVISVYLAAKGMFVTSTDINPEALINTKVNSILNRVEDNVDTILSDIFDNVLKLTKFDLVFWNTPFIYHDELQINLLERSVFDSEYNGIKKYISGVKYYLNETGRAFLGFSSSSGNFELLNKICEKNNIEIHLYAQTFFADESNADAFSVELYELLVNKGF
jgi:HemK-related putative methylase